MLEENRKKIEKAEDIFSIFIMPLFTSLNYIDSIMKFLIVYLIGIVIFFFINKIRKKLFWSLFDKFF